jgi:hypothetical protein
MELSIENFTLHMDGLNLTFIFGLTHTYKECTVNNKYVSLLMMSSLLLWYKQGDRLNIVILHKMNN